MPSGRSYNRQDALDLGIEQALPQDPLPHHSRCSEENHFHMFIVRVSAALAGLAVPRSSALPGSQVIRGSRNGAIDWNSRKIRSPLETLRSYFPDGSPEGASKRL